MQGALNSAAYAAAVGKHPSILKYLLENGVSVTGDRTALVPGALRSRDLGILEVMHEHGWEAEQINKDMARHQFAL